MCSEVEQDTKGKVRVRVGGGVNKSDDFVCLFVCLFVVAFYGNVNVTVFTTSTKKLNAKYPTSSNDNIHKSSLSYANMSN